MKPQVFNLIFSISVVLMMVLGSLPVNAAMYTFSGGFTGYSINTGYSGSGIVTGSFSGSDVGNLGDSGPDGKIYYCGTRECHGFFQELQGFSIHFSGDTTIENLNDIHLTYFEYNLSTHSLGLGSGSQESYVQYDLGNGWMELNVPYVDVFRWQLNQPLVVSQVPLPAGLFLFATGLASLFGLTRQKTTS